MRLDLPYFAISAQGVHLPSITDNNDWNMILLASDTIVSHRGLSLYGAVLSAISLIKQSENLIGQLCRVTYLVGDCHTN